MNPEPVIIPRLKSVAQLEQEYLMKYREFWQFYSYRDEFIPGFRDCYYCTKFDETVDSPAVARISVNVWGTVVERDVCLEHADRDGARADD
jgi:hypothetical protein